MSYKKPSEQNTPNKVLKDECILLSTVYDDYVDYFPLDRLNQKDSPSSFGSVFFLAVCITFLVIIAHAWMPTAVIDGEVERTTIDIIL